MNSKIDMRRGIAHLFSLSADDTASINDLSFDRFFDTRAPLPGQFEEGFSLKSLFHVPEENKEKVAKTNVDSIENGNDLEIVSAEDVVSVDVKDTNQLRHDLTWDLLLPK